MQVISFAFNPFLENTYVLFDESGECVIVDPGCYQPQERQLLDAAIAERNLRPVLLLNTHCHIDHVFGNRHVVDTYKVSLAIHRDELAVLESVPEYAKMFGTPFIPSPSPDRWLMPGEKVSFGLTQLEVLFTPGHAPGHVSFYHSPTLQVLSGDVLFRGSVGRTDLPGGNTELLLKSIREVLLPLGDDVTVLSGHGPKTTIGHERKTNPFLNQ
jgi:hydroxyacylglutathione hydrolase